MDVYNFMNQKMTAARRGEQTGINFPYLYKLTETGIQKIVRKIYLN